MGCESCPMCGLVSVGRLRKCELSHYGYSSTILTRRRVSSAHLRMLSQFRNGRVLESLQANCAVVDVNSKIS